MKHYASTREMRAALLDATDLVEVKFKSPATAGIRYVAYSHELGIFCRDYYFINGGHHPVRQSRLKDVRATCERLTRLGFREF